MVLFIIIMATHLSDSSHWNHAQSWGHYLLSLGQLSSYLVLILKSLNLEASSSHHKISWKHIFLQKLHDSQTSSMLQTSQYLSCSHYHKLINKGNETQNSIRAYTNFPTSQYLEPLLTFSSYISHKLIMFWPRCLWLSQKLQALHWLKKMLNRQ